MACNMYCSIVSCAILLLFHTIVSSITSVLLLFHTLYMNQVTEKLYIDPCSTNIYSINSSSQTLQNSTNAE